MKTFQVTYLLGHSGREPELRYTPDGQAVTAFSLATDRPVKGRPAETDWHRVVAFGALGEFCNAYVAKGRRLFVIGRLSYRSWTGEDGRQRFGVDIVAQRVLLLDRRPGAEGGEPPEEPSDVPDLPF